MFDQLIKRSFYRQKHLDAPLLDERIAYIQYWADQGRSLNTLKTIAENLLRIVEFLHLETFRIVTLKEIENAANEWGRYRYNHPQKRAKFSKGGKERFTWYAINWLKNLKCLEPLPEEQILLFNKIFKRRKALQRHVNAPLLEERLKYLQYWSDNGAVPGTLRYIAHYLLRVMSYLDLEKNNIVTISAIQKAAEKWAGRPADRKQRFSKTSMMRFKNVATEWLCMLGRIKYPEEKTNPSLELVAQYVDYMRDERGFSEETIYPRISVLKDFVRRLGGHCSLENLDILRIEEILKSKHYVGGLCRRTIQSYASNIRSFLRYLEEKGFCQQGLAESIKLARTYRHEALPSSPSWDDVKQLLKKTEGDSPTNIRDRAIIMILAVYGLRCGEVVKLKLEDLDWKQEILYVRGRKNGTSQEYPLSQTVGDAILRYIKQVRPNTCPCREVFITMKAPHGPLDPSAVFQIVSRLYKGLDVKIKHHGPHSLRHACATRLINEKVSLKEISDYLGHHSLESTRIYAKVDLTSLRKVADFEIGDLI